MAHCWLMGLGFESHQGHWCCQEGRPTTFAPVTKILLCIAFSSGDLDSSGIFFCFSGFGRVW